MNQLNKVKNAKVKLVSNRNYFQQNEHYLREQQTWLSTKDASFELKLKAPTSFTVRGGAFEPSTMLTLTYYIQRVEVRVNNNKTPITRVNDFKSSINQ